MNKQITVEMLDIPEEIIQQWQGILDIMAELANIPAGLIMRLQYDDIEVFLSSASAGNHYEKGAREYFSDSGLYCETVINSKSPLHVPNALADPAWLNNPDVKLNMISYLGYPLSLPNGNPFGTICILDNKANHYSDTIKGLVEKFKEIVQHHIELIYMNKQLGEDNKKLSDYLDELQKLRGLIPICISCKKIKNHDGYWKSVEQYLINHPKADFSHGYCPECYEKRMREMDDFFKDEK